MIFPGGVTLARLGTEHIHIDDHMDIATVALAMTVVEWLKNHDQISPTPGSDIAGHPAETPAAGGDVSAKPPESSP
jgi:hypothetical protein